MTEALLVSSSGGHLDELVELADRFVPEVASKVWVTPRTAHAESLLVSQEVHFVPPVGARQLGQALRSLPAALSTVRSRAPVVVVSTGAALAVPYLAAARLSRVPSIFIDSATRLRGPSLSGRIARSIGVETLHCQAVGWPGPWRPIPSVFNGFKAAATDTNAPVRRVVVMLGTERFPLDRAVTAMVDAARELDLDVTWQLGHTPAQPGMPGRVNEWLPYADLAAAIADADAVVTHAGVGSVLTALRAGRLPVVFPRRHDLTEHVDDHQRELAAALFSDGLAIDADDRPLPDLLRHAASSRVHRVPTDA